MGGVKKGEKLFLPGAVTQEGRDMDGLNIRDVKGTVGLLDGPAIRPLSPTRELDAHHDHARHPEEQDVVAGLEQLPGVEGLQVLRLLGPLEHGEGEPAGREPARAGK